MTRHEEDWWNDIYDEAVEPADEDPSSDEADDQPAASGPFVPQPDYYPQPHMPAVLTQVPERAALSPRTRKFLYNASAAGAGWGLGLYEWFADAVAECGTDYSISGALVLGIGGCLLIAHVWDRRTRHWWPGIAWAARIPLATAITALALWAPAA